MTAPYDTLDTNLPLVDENGKVTPEFEDYLYKHDILISSATPEASVTANPSTLCLDATNSILYIKKTGTGNTGWMAVGGTGSGGVSDGDKGDITVSGSGTVWTIDNDVVSLAKFVNATAQYKLLGRVSSGSGDFEEISSSSNVFSILQAADYAAIRTLLGLVIGTNVQAYDATLAALSSYNTNGILTQTAADTFTGRTITGTTNQVTVTNGDGVSGNPTLSLPQDIATSSNPQFATIEVGAATDTTVARASAGRISVEGVEVALMTDVAVLSTYSAQTRTQGTYTPATTSVVAMTSELDIVLTPTSLASKNILQWTIFGEADVSYHGVGFVVYRDVDGGGFSLLANSRDGSSNYWSVTAMPVFDTSNQTPSSLTFQIIDTSITAGSTHTYRLYAANTRSAVSAVFYLNRAVSGTGADAVETGLSTCLGMCVK